MNSSDFSSKLNEESSDCEASDTASGNAGNIHEETDGLLFVEAPVNLPDVSKRRRSTAIQADHAGCYLSYDEALGKWVATWSPNYMADAVAILTPTVKVPQFKYNKKERAVLESEKSSSRDVRRDFLEGFCMFFKLVRDFKGNLTLLPSGEDNELKHVMVVGLIGNQLVRFDKFDITYPFIDVDCIAVISKRSLAFTGKNMEQPIFVGKAGKEGFALTLKSRG